MKDYKYNCAQQLLISIGGTAVLVGGYKGNAIPDLQQPKQEKKERKIHYGEFIRSMYADKRKAVLDDKRIAAQ